MKSTFVFLIGSLKKGGAERNLALVASHMASKGHRVVIVLFEDRIEFSLHPRVEIVSLNIHLAKTRFGKAGRVIKGVRNILRKEKPRYAVAFTRMSSQFLAVSLYPNVIARFDIYPFFARKRKRLLSFILFNLRNVKKVVSPSVELKENVNQFFINPKKVVVISNPVAQKTACANLNDVGLPSPYFIVAGRLTHQKRVDLIIQAFANTKCKEHYKIVILGEGKKKQELVELTASLNLANVVLFKGFVDNPNEIISKARCLILASDSEGFPNVLVEALSLGTPVISSNCPTGPKEIVVDGHNGLLFEKGNAMLLANAIDKIAYDELLYAYLKQNSINSVSKFDSKVILEKWEALLLDLDNALD